MSCIVRGCRSHSGYNENLSKKISFHKFPTNDNIRKLWFSATNRSEKQYKRFWRLCSRHFKPDCFVGENSLRVRLKENAVPTLNLCSGTGVAMDLATKDDSCTPQSSTCELATCDMALPSVNQQKSSTDLPMLLATSSTTGSAETSTTEKAIYEGRIHELQNRIRKLELIARNRLLKLNAEKQRTRRLKKKNSSINQKLIELLEREEID